MLLISDVEQFRFQLRLKVLSGLTSLQLSKSEFYVVGALTETAFDGRPKLSDM